jgi:hypothetical protein
MLFTSALLIVSLGGRAEMNNRSTFSPAVQRDVIAFRAARAVFQLLLRAGRVSV